MSVIRTAIDKAVAEVIAEHPKYFTPKGMESARALIVRKVMASLRDGGEKPDPQQSDAPPPQPRFVLAAADSREARAFTNLRQLAGAIAPTSWRADGCFSIPAATHCEAVFALADLPAAAAWIFTASPAQIAAWMEFFRERLPGVARRSIAQERNGETGILMPWPWPPSKDGKIYEPEAT